MGELEEYQEVEKENLQPQQLLVGWEPEVATSGSTLVATVVICNMAGAGRRLAAQVNNW